MQLKSTEFKQPAHSLWVLGFEGLAVAQKEKEEMDRSELIFKELSDEAQKSKQKNAKQRKSQEET